MPINSFASKYIGGERKYAAFCGGNCLIGSAFAAMKKFLEKI